MFIIWFQFNEDYQLHGLGSTVNFLGVPQNGEYHKDVFKAISFFLFKRLSSRRLFSNSHRTDVTLRCLQAACVLPSEHTALVSAAISNAEANCTEAQRTISS